MASITDLTGAGESDRTFETAKVIDITRNTIKFGDSVYQFRNLTGFTVGTIPKDKFPFQSILFLLIGGVLTVAFVVGWFLLLFAAFLVFKHFTQVQNYGLSLFFNSGEEKFFVSSNRSFLMDIVSGIYKFMEDDRYESLRINIAEAYINPQIDKSVNVGGDLHGIANTGDSNTLT